MAVIQAVAAAEEVNRIFAIGGARVRALPRFARNLHGGLAKMDETFGLELCDLGDAAEETKQCAPDPAIFPDSWFQWGAVEWHPGGGCPW